MTYRRLLLLLVSGGLSFLGCTGGGATTETVPSYTARDSAGVQIVEIRGVGRSDADWRLASAPEMIIGALDGPPEQQLYRALDAARLPDGRLVVLNSGTSELRFYASDGTYLSSAGAEGDGPGEFRGLSSIDVVGDSIYAWDQRLMRVSVLDLAGRFGRSFHLAAPAEHSMPRYRASFADGSCLVGVSGIASGPLEDRSLGKTSITLMHYDPLGEPLDTVVVTQNEPSYRLRHPDGRGFSFFYVPFAPGGTWALDGKRVLEGTGETYEVRTLDQEGHLLRILRAAVEATPVTSALYNAYVQEQLAASRGDEDWHRLMKDAYGHMPRPETARVFDALATDGDGRLWVRRTPMPGDTVRQWDVFDEVGRYVARALTPAHLRVREIGSDYVLALQRDELDVEQVVLFRIQKREAI